MPLRPAVSVWVFAAPEPDALERAIRARCTARGFVVEVVAADADRRFLMSVSKRALARAVEEDVTRLDPPASGTMYRLEIVFRGGDAADPRPRMEVAPVGDNWSGWALIGPLADEIAVELGGREITGDPPPWLAIELAAAEPPIESSLPALALRTASVFPGFARAVSFRRPASVAVIDKLIADGVQRVVFVIQRDLAQDWPQTVADVHPVGLRARILRSQRAPDGWTLILKGIERVQIRSLDPGELVTAGFDAIPPADEPPTDAFEALREHARYDPFVANVAGASLIARIDTLPIGVIADLVASAGTDPAVLTSVFLELDPAKRAAIVAI